MELGTAIAVVSLPGLVATGIRNLYELCTKLKDAPQELRSLLADLAFLERQLNEFQALVDDESQAEENRVLIRTAVQRCEDDMKKLLDFVTDLTVEIKSKRWKQVRSSITTVLKEGTIAKLKAKLDRAQRGLELASQLVVIRNTQNIVHRLEDSNQQQLEVKLQTVKIDANLLEIDGKIESINQRLGKNEKACLLVASQLESTMKQVVEETILPNLQKILIRQEVLNRKERTAENYEHRPNSTTNMSEKVRDCVFSPHPSVAKFQDGRAKMRQVFRPSFRKSTSKLYDGSYSSWLANVQYRSRLVRIVEVLDDQPDSDSQNESSWNVRHEIETSFMIFPNSWLSNKGVKGSYKRTSEGWLSGINFTPFNMRPHDALIFEFCSAGNLEAVKSLLSRGDASPFDTDPDGWTPLHCAAQSQNGELCKLLISFRADANAVDLRNRSPLHVALSQRPARLPYLSGSSKIEEEEAPAVVRLLVAGGRANPAMETCNGENCYDLIASTEKGCSDLFIWLLRQSTFDFDPHRRDSDGCTPIMKLSIMRNATKSDIEDLIYLGADVNARVTPPEDYEGSYEPGWTALHIILSHSTFCQDDPQERIGCLLAQGADVHALSDRGETPTDIAFRSHTREKFDLWMALLEDSGYAIEQFVVNEIRTHTDVPWYVLNWCDYYLEALLELDDKLEMDLRDRQTSHLFVARELDTVQQRRSNHNEVPADPSESDADEWGWLDDLVPDSPVLSLDEQCAELRATMRDTWHRLLPGQGIWCSPNRGNLWSMWNRTHSREEWILYGLYPI